MFCLVTAVLTIAGQAEPFSGYGEGLGDLFRKRYPVQIGIMKIKNFITGKAVKVMVLFSVRIKPPGISLAFHNIDDLNPGKGDQGAVHRIQRNVGEAVQKLFVDLVCTGMLF